MTDPEKISLKTFWDAIEQRLAACSGEELRNILRAMAQETPPSERRAFLDRLENHRSYRAGRPAGGH